MFNFLKRNQTGPNQKSSEKSEEMSATSSLSTPQKNLSLFSGLARTRDKLVLGMMNIFSGNKRFAAAEIENLENQLIQADIGVNVAQQIITELKESLKNEKEIDVEVALRLIKNYLEGILAPVEKPLIIEDNIKPYVILFVGVNGTGKTTTIGKLAAQLQHQGKKVMLAAGDTFRAAAIDQLKVWGERNQVTVIAQQPGSDSAAVIFDALQSARARLVDVLIADTAGRLHTQNNLMAELKKIKKSLQKIDPSAPHEIILVLDATTGQNALNQAKQFTDEIGTTGICITKLDGTAKGGIIFAIAKQLKLPIRYIGVGETIGDLKVFNAKDFVAALFGDKP